MNISYKWLKEYVDFDLTPQQTADALTSIGLEVDGVQDIESIKGGLKGLYVGQVLSCIPHPNSDHMHICTVDWGQSEPSQIVCGAPNVAQGQKVIVATLGCKLYDNDQEFVIKKSKLRGIESFGMICAEDEIGIGTNHMGIIVLPANAKIGTPAADYYGIENDTIIEIDITPNRADACSHYGVARDLYAWLIQNGYKTNLHKPADSMFKVDNHDLEFSVEIDNKELCPRYCAVSIEDCEVKESPKWLQDHLRAIGLRPINNIVDITNYIMMAYGQPLHCFDADMIKGKKIIVKTLPEGTPFTTLDGEQHKLSQEDLAICNTEEPMCIAGVFGGKGSGTYETTRNVLFESAYFNPTTIRKSAHRHGLSTDASFRFERGVDPNGTIYALKQAALLAKELAGGKISMNIVDIYPTPIKEFPVTINFQYVHNLIGKKFPKETIKSIIKSLEIQIINEDEEKLQLLVPTYRVDVQRPCDIVEDILRIYGYNNVEITTNLQSSLTIKGEEDHSNKLQNIISEQLTACGFHEIMNNSLSKLAYYNDGKTYNEAKCVKVINPLSEDLSVMRQTLLFGGLESIRFNINHKAPNLMMYEFGNCYSFNKLKQNKEFPLNAYHEDLHLGLWVTGKHVEGSWTHPDEENSIFVLKAYIKNIIIRLGINPQTLVCKEENDDILSQGLSLTDHEGKEYIKYGIVNSTLTAKAQVFVTVFYADFNWTNLMKKTSHNKVTFYELSKFPAVRRDLALLLDKNISFSQIEEVAYNTERKFLKNIELFDVYQGEKLPIGKKSYAVNFVLQDDKKTMGDKQIEKIMENIVNTLKQKLGAELR